MLFRSNTQYFVTLLNGQEFKKKYGTYLVFSSLINFKEVLNVENLFSYEFKITGAVRKYKKINSSGSVYYVLFFAKIISIETMQSPLKKELSRLKIVREKLASSNWVTKLSNDELEGIRNQVQIARARLNIIEKTLDQLSEFSSHIPPLFFRVKKAIHFFRIHKVKPQQEIPNSMVFLQNPLYASAKSLYKKVSNLNGMDDSLLNSMMAIDEIGLVSLPNLYERWCLLQLIIVIKDVFRFQVQKDWQQKLIDAVLKKKKNVEINFSCNTRQLSIKLTYEKELVSCRRPDYVIDLFFNTYLSNYEKDILAYEEHGPIKWYVHKEKVQRMVIDAKFRGNVSEQHINNLVDEMYVARNYSECGNNSVFVVHPVANVVTIKNSPLEWGSYCNYGQADEINHKKGAIYLSPSRNHSGSIDNLQRLIGMLLQSNTAILDDGERLNVIWHNKTCLSCGGSDLSIYLEETKAGNNVNKIQCNYCRQRAVETQCVSCKRPLYKNGINWTYHRTRAEQTTNVVCPQCETFL